MKSVLAEFKLYLLRFDGDVVDLMGVIIGNYFDENDYHEIIDYDV